MPAFLQKLYTAVLSAVQRVTYVVAGYDPKTVADFVNEYYRTNGTETDFDSMFTYTGASNKVMTDSDGNLKWAPHNIFKSTDDLTDAAWTKEFITETPGQSDPDGGTTAHLLAETTDNNYHRLRYDHTTSSGTTYECAMVVKAYGSTRYIYFRDNMVGGTTRNTSYDLTDVAVDYVNSDHTASITSLGGDWYLIKTKLTETTGAARSIGILTSNVAVTDDTLQTFVGSTSNGIYVAYVSLYVASLGGMVDNPDGPASGAYYIENTTASAIYLPRRKSHRYDNGGYKIKGLTLESAAATNKITDSIGVSDWTASSAGVLTVDATTGPFGNGHEIADDNVGGTGTILTITPIMGGMANTTVTFSVWMKANGVNWGAVYTDGWTTPPDVVICYFDLSTGAVGTEASGVTGQIEDWGDGWYRCIMTFATDPVDAGGQIYIRPAESDNVVSDARDGTSSIYFGGAQLEVSPVPTSYIPTSGATATRSAETLDIPDANLPTITSTDVSFNWIGEADIDTDAAFACNMFRWGLNGSNWFFGTVKADINPDQVRLWHEIGNQKTEKGLNVTDNPLPGLNAEISFAARVENAASGAINVGYKGTSATAGTIGLGGMYDPAGYDFEVGRNSGGGSVATGDIPKRVALLRIWDVDIGDTGIEEATS